MRIGILGAGGVGATVAGAVVKDKNAEIVLIARGETKENVLKKRLDSGIRSFGRSDHPSSAGQ
ncbi:MAG: 2-dehydropantoate 2-reductase N-terminal domain-containing protein [Anaerotignum sp.]